MANWRKIGRIATYSVLGTAAVASGLWFYFGKGGVRDANALRATFNEQKQEIAERQMQVEELSKSLAAVERKDEAAMELAARRYGLVGETEYMWKVTSTPEDSLSE